MKRLIVGFLCFVALASGAWAQTADSPLPVHRDLVEVRTPAGYTMLSEQAGGGRYMAEYVPMGESAARWSRMLTVISLGTAQQLPHILLVAEQMFQSMVPTCADLKTDEIAYSGGEVTYTVYCQLREGASLPGVDLRRHEIAVYKFVETEEMVYSIQFATHSDQDSEALEENRRRFFDDALDVFKLVEICDLKSGQPCRLDVDLMDKSHKAATTYEPTCRSIDPSSCLPVASLRLVTSPSLSPKPEEKELLLYVDMSDADLTKMGTLGSVLNEVATGLRGGAPAMSVIIRADEKGAVISPDERAAAGSFLQLVKGSALQMNLIDAGGANIVLQDFR